MVVVIMVMGCLNVLSEGAKKTKSTREKRRRDVLNSRFEEFSVVFELGEL